MKPNSINPVVEQLKSETGIKFEYYRTNFLERKIEYRMRTLNIGSLQTYFNYLRTNSEEINKFKEKFTVVYSYFFRNYEIYEKLKEIIDSSNNNVKNPILIWSCPSASGEEPYSIAMLFDQIKKNNKQFPPFKIVASDIDKNAIVIAKEGVYGEYAVHETPGIYLNTYFSKQETLLGLKYTLSEEIKKNVEFIEEDIINGHAKDYKYDIIFCRNFFIYLRRKAQEKLLKVLESKLKDGGLLVLGIPESIFSKDTSIKLLDPKVRFYVKNGHSRHSLFKKEIYDQIGGHISQAQILSQVKEFTLQKAENKASDTPVKGILIQSEPGLMDNAMKSSIIVENNPYRTKNPIIKTPNPKITLNRTKKGAELKLEKKIKTNIKTKTIMKREIAVQTNNLIVLEERSNKELNIQKPIPIREEIEIKKIPLKTREVYAPFIMEDRYRQLEQQEIQLKQRELLLIKKEKSIEQAEIRFQQQRNFLENRKNKIAQRMQHLKHLFSQEIERESKFKERMKELDNLVKQVEQKAKRVELREAQLDQRINQLGQHSKQVLDQEKLEKVQNSLEHSFEEYGVDRIINPTSRGELLLPAGYYGIINLHSINEKASKFSIHGLGAGITLILKDSLNKIYAMSRISLPDSKKSKSDYHLLFPHTFVDTATKDLLNKILYNGAEKENVMALIVGGAKLFTDFDLTFQENIDAIKKELKSLQINIELEELGGIGERSIIYDTLTNSLFIQKTWETEYRKIT